MRRLALVCWMVALLGLGSLPGCGGGYRLAGKVVEGPVSSVSVVDRHDPRLDQPGLPGASVQSTLDPEDVGRKRLAEQTSDDSGAFAIPVGEPGAGFLEYEVEVLARMGGYQSAVGTIPLPGRDKRLLITLTPGRDTYGSTGSDAFLEDTMRMSEPFLRE